MPLYANDLLGILAERNSIEGLGTIIKDYGYAAIEKVDNGFSIDVV